MLKLGKRGDVTIPATKFNINPLATNWLLIFRHSRLVVQYIFPNVKHVYACRQWRIQEFFVWSTTSQLASLRHRRWNESPWDPSWGEERNGNRLAPSPGCRADGREPQTSASPEHQLLREQSCIVMQQQIGDVDRLTRHTLRRRFLMVSMYRAELTVLPASKNSVM